MDDFAVDRVLLAVEQIPPGRVAAYGDIGRITGTSPRQVGSILRHYGSDVPWWRVVGSSGDPGGSLLARARPHWAIEHIAVRPNGLGCRMADYRADQVALALAYRTALTALLDQAGTALPPIGQPAVEALRSLGITRLEQVLEHSEPELLALPRVGPVAIRQLDEALAERGWRWRSAVRHPGR